MLAIVLPCFFTITDTSTSPFSPLSLHDALPIFQPQLVDGEYGLLEYDLDPGSYTVQASRSGYDTAQSTFSLDRKSTRLNSSHVAISYAVFCLKKKISFITY